VPTIMRTSPSVEDLFKQNVEKAGLDLNKTPAAVQLATQALGSGIAPFSALLEDLPANARAFEWMSCALRAYAEWCDFTVVVDSTEETAEKPADGDAQATDSE
jgi:hypothetical protein